VRYVSTRGQTEPQSFGDVLIAGIAPDGGLFVPESWPKVGADEIKTFAKRSFPDVAHSLLERFVGESFSSDALKADIDAAYRSFDAPDVAPLSKLGDDLFLLELFHGPTLSFKDIAMQVLGRFFARALKARGERATVVVATSGDTGSAAVAALGGLPSIELFVIHPHQRVSEVQRRQMTTSPDANVHNIALEGTFDDAQAIVKGLFADKPFAQRVHLTAVNSINFARIAIQTVYYFTAAARLDRPPIFVVPTGNFGDIFAGEAAMRMGLAAEKLVIATNANDILARALNDGVYAAGRAHATLSPSMDIQVASNFERGLFEASARNTVWLAAAMAEFADNRKLQIPEKVLLALRGRYAAACANDDKTLEVIGRMHRETGRLIDPHTAVGLAAAEALFSDAKAPVVVLSTAHPGKFPDAIAQATGSRPPLPPALAGVFDRPEKYQLIGNKLPLVRAFIEARLAHHES
jgi:threonine synthase